MLAFSATRRGIKSCMILALLLSALFSWPIDFGDQRTSAGEQQATSADSRRNIGRFFAKLRAGKEVTIAYFGGTISSGAGDGTKGTYRTLITDHLRKRYPQAKIREINASVPNTGSLYGSMRARRDVIAHKPDLVFIEFAVDDASEKEHVVKRAIEGVIRQFLTVSQPPELVLLYATSAARNSCVDWHETIASYYRLPSINLQEHVWSLIDAGKLTPSSFWKDGILPLDAGNKIYAEAIISYLADQENVTPSGLYRAIPPPLLSDELTYGELIPFAQLEHDAGWKTETRNDRVLPSPLLTSDKAGAQIETYFEGTVVGIALRMGPDAGTIECLIDGRPAPAPLDRIDAYDTTHHIATRIIAGGLGPGEHKLTLRISGEKNAKSSGNNVRLGYLIVGGQRPERL